ncbi:hypothetical protein [Vibrio coralliilyticus]|uniref:hypothetical protein n=1 Tax=Vibrio coralliilyticus TaxID=190893 RepID=UPI00148B3F3F|nr:hypothetical protein [Vibrio coralliilyticus]NOI50330.1 hypothetical protein [Vibrio coralliilyticus]
MIEDNELLQLKNHYEGKRLYRAKNEAYKFDLFDTVWQLSPKSKEDLNWTYEKDYDADTFVNVRLLLAEMANRYPASTVRTRIGGIRSVGNQLSLPAFKIAWLTFNDNLRKNLATIFSSAVKKCGLTQFNELYEFTKDNRPSFSKYENILDVEKGCYSDYEFNHIKQGLRLETDRQIKFTTQQGNYGVRRIGAFSNLVAGQLMSALMRRPSQLAQLKWCDVLPVGERFLNHRQSNNELVPKYDYMFSDVECLHIRTFRGKDGGFRSSVETRSHRLEPELSSLLLLFRKQYEVVLKGYLINQDIILSPYEMNHIMLSCPLFPEETLFTTAYQTKENIFKAVGNMSQAFHKSPEMMRKAIETLSTKLNLKSDRIEDEKIEYSNNRLRHTVLTTGARNNLSKPYLASITNVTEKAVESYVDLDVNGRVIINEAFAELDVLRKFGTISVNDLLKNDEFIVRNEFDEEIGVYCNSDNCSSCKSKLGAPLGCYPCRNFLPKEEANHQQYLNKALVKYELNKSQGNKATVKKLKEIIVYIQATIKVCDERNNLKRGLDHE